MEAVEASLGRRMVGPLVCPSALVAHECRRANQACERERIAGQPPEALGVLHQLAFDHFAVEINRRSRIHRIIRRRIKGADFLRSGHGMDVNVSATDALDEVPGSRFALVFEVFASDH